MDTIKIGFDRESQKWTIQINNNKFTVIKFQQLFTKKVHTKPLVTLPIVKTYKLNVYRDKQSHKDQKNMIKF